MCYNILKKIQKSFDLLDREANWDDEGTEKMDRKLYIKALKFFLDLVDNIEGDTEDFDMDLMRDGKICGDFHEKNFQLLILVGKESIAWYGDDHHNNDRIKSSQIDESPIELIAWLNKNLKKSV